MSTRRLQSSSGRSRAVRQKTLARSVTCAGIGLHSGVTVTMTLHPAEIDSGIVFRRVDLDSADIPARWDTVVDTRLHTVIANADGALVGTIEHLMAALAGCGVDNVRVDVDASELPIMDGSSAPFVALIERAGLIRQDAVRRAIEVLKPVTGGAGERRVELTPADGFSVDFEIDFASPVVGQATKSVQLVNGTFKAEIAAARTFGFRSDVEKLQAMGLARGGSLDNAIVVDGDRVLNDGGLRFRDEFVRHKILDCVGDLYLAGGPILGHVRAFRSGHHTNNEALRALFADESAYRLVDLEPGLLDHDAQVA